MKITLGNKVGVAKAGKKSTYTADCGNLNAAVAYAFTMATKLNERMIVVQGNSYMNKVFHIAKESDDIAKFLGMRFDVYKVVVVETNGDVFYAHAA